ncbi:hypothetical protein Slala02_05680 [Streptomyces lavendulae subsp. lavendulae]|nr:hypothetical protein Slala01_10370 [Streptomyces lavendulae subsp. lavendulae]GLX24748.1 hypothetical protein Slala02_05680 [Streptomyces lavendulae subsp. lavendulae]
MTWSASSRRIGAEAAVGTKAPSVYVGRSKRGRTAWRGPAEWGGDGRSPEAMWVRRGSGRPDIQEANNGRRVRQPLPASVYDRVVDRPIKGSPMCRTVNSAVRQGWLAWRQVVSSARPSRAAPPCAPCSLPDS